MVRGEANRVSELIARARPHLDRFGVEWPTAGATERVLW